MPDDALIVRNATVQPSTFNDKDKTVRVTFSTGAAVLRRDQAGPYYELLSLDPAHVNLDRLRGASVLNNHRQGGLQDVIGVVDRAGVEPGAGWADLRFSGRPEVQPVVDDVKAGVIRHVSVGYSVQAWKEGKDAAGQRTKTAIAWTPQEISFVPLPADPGASVRKDPMSDTSTVIPPAPPPAVTAPQATNTRAEVNTAIRSIATASGLGTAWADGQIDANASTDQARGAAYDEMVKRGAVIRTHRVEGGASGDDPAVQRGLMAEALAARALPGLKVSDAARPYMGHSMLDLAAQLLRVRGERVPTAREELAERAMHTTSDFPNLLTSTGNRVLMAAYEAAPNPLKVALARQTTLNDFRPKSMLKLSGLPKLAPVTEAGEIKAVTRSETRDGYSLGTFASIFALSRRAIINDDLGAFTDFSTAAGVAAAETEADQLVQLLISPIAGPVMGDGKRLFDATHGNLAASGAPISTASLSTARQAMRNQKGIDGKQPINAAPKFLLVAPDRETEAEQALAQLYAATAAQVNAFAAKLEILVEARLPAGAWYVFADPASLPVLEYAYLSSAQGPQITTRDGWDVLGTEFRVVLDFGCGAIDWRGAYRNSGS